MKSMKKLVLFLLAGVMAVNYGCNKEETQDNPALTVTLSKTTASPGDVVNVAITTSSSGTVDRLVIEEKSQGASGTVKLLDSAVKQANFGITYEYTVPMGASGTKDIIVTVTDNLGQTSTKTETITISGTGTLKACNAVTLGAQDNNTGSSLNTAGCTVYTVTDAKNNAASVDLVYFYGATNQATVAGPSDDNFGSGANQISSLGVHTWGVRNATMLRKITGFNFDAATVASVAAAYNDATAAEDTKANMLAVGDMVAFKTANGRFGVFRVTNISAGATGTITIDVKSTM